MRILRDGAVVADNLDLSSLRREKDDASEVREGFECGLVLRNFQDIKIGDIVEAFEMREIPRSLITESGTSCPSASPTGRFVPHQRARSARSARPRRARSARSRVGETEQP